MSCHVHMYKEVSVYEANTFLPCISTTCDPMFNTGMEASWITKVPLGVRYYAGDGTTKIGYVLCTKARRVKADCDSVTIVGDFMWLYTPEDVNAYFDMCNLLPKTATIERYLHVERLRQDVYMVSQEELILSDHIEHNKTFQCFFVEYETPTTFTLHTTARIPHITINRGITIFN